MYRELLSKPLPEWICQLSNRDNEQHNGANKMDQNVEQQVALIVEDDVELRSLAAALLEETDLHVVEMSSGEDALHYLDHHSGEVAFLFSDVRLPRLMSGVDLARSVRLKWPWIRTVLTSGAPLEDNLDKALIDVRFMPKPWRALEILKEADKAARAGRFEEAMSHAHTGSFVVRSA
jgi:DNA-binding NtrC family response regulator